jgi:hypothetical protein
MPILNLNSTDKNIYKGSSIVGTTDVLVEANSGYFDIPDILVKGDLNGELEYRGKRILIEQVDMLIGMEIGNYGPRGPVWKKVRAKILD